MPYAFKYKRKHSRSHIYFHAKINKSETLIKGGGGLYVCLAFRVNMDLMELSHGKSITF